MKTKSKKPPISRSEVIRQLLKEEPKATAGRIVDLAAARGTAITTQLVYNVMSVQRKNKGKQPQGNGKLPGPVVAKPALTTRQPQHTGKSTRTAETGRNGKALQPS